jgi:nitroimidazol reductase NimA-like FMN-containing flavoprotein (pyridoxamine 5'-phosphate oxidase superfamily)
MPINKGVAVNAPTDHAGTEVLRTSECLSLLESRPIGRLGFVEAGQVSILPVRYMMDSGQVVFRSSVGAKLDAAVRWQSVAFEVDDWDPRDRTGWSVLIHGVANEVIDEARREALNARNLDEWVINDRPKAWIEIRPNEITGRRILPPLPPIG